MDDLPRTLLSQYFLHRLGLTADELCWPRSKDEVSKVDVADTVPEAWRVRDAITDILKENGVALNVSAEDVQGEVVSISSLLDNITPSDEDVAQFKVLYNSDADGSDDAMDVDTDKLNINHVYKAFNAAAYAVIMGHKDGKAKPVVKQEDLQGQVYEPPFIQAMESIRASRINSLNEASGKSAPPFLKKSTTIPWFHLPTAGHKKQQPDAAPSTIAKVVRGQSVSDKTKEDKDEKKEVDPKKTEKKTVKRPAPETKAPAEKKAKLDNNTGTSPKPKTKSSPKKIESETQSTTTPSKTKTPTVRLGNQANVSRAILCAAAAMVFQKSSPDFEQSANEDSKIDPTIMPRQIIEVEAAKRAASKKKRDLDISVDVAVDQATIISRRVLDRMLGASKRYDRRRDFRLDIARSRVQRGLMRNTSHAGKFVVTPGHSLPLVISNPFMEEGRSSTDSEAMDTDEECCLTDGPVKKENDVEWTKSCLPRLLSILRTGPGHAIMHDIHWKDRAFRVAELLKNMAAKSPNPDSIENYGPHLIVTTGHDIHAFVKVFGQIGHDLQVVRKDDEAIAGTPALRVLKYHGTKEKRRRLRKHFSTLVSSPDSPYCFLGGHADSPYHVVLTTYSDFSSDYMHFCQIPFQAVVMDDGMSWLGCANADPNTKLGKVWETALWSSSDHGAGMAGVNGGSSSWDFSKDDGGIEKEAAPMSSKVGFMRRDSSSSGLNEKTSRGKLLLGLTARHRVLLASNMHAKCHGQLHKASVSSLLSFLAPHFLDSVQEDWDKSKMAQCVLSAEYFRKLIARSVVVYSGASSVADPKDLFSLALKSLNGELTLAPSPTELLSGSPDAKKQATLQRKDALAWFRPGSAILAELNDSSLDSILNVVKRHNSMGFVCEAIVPASTLTASGSNGAVTGPAAFRMGVRCGRQFSNEQSLKQHMVAFHAPAGTWLCKACGEDCVTSQAKSNHEKTCNGNAEGMIPSAAMAAAMHSDHRRGKKRKEIKGLAAAKVKKDGSKRVEGFNGVWVKPDGKYFIKIEGKVIEEKKEDESQKDAPMLFASAEDAAKQRDQILKDTGRAEVAEMNYKPDGSRIIHEKAETKPNKSDPGVSEEGHHVIVPALSVVNIKNLPPDIKPLLRDPNQTSRTGGTSKRYVYAYRGVCRQARKGHDRWQAQISFNGFNHYLGTFDSEWDAAAVYAWAHLILYGEEATKQAQKEGEDAAAAYAQLQKDIAEGKVDPSVLSSPKKKKRNSGAPKLGPQKGRRGPRKPAFELSPEMEVVPKKEAQDKAKSLEKPASKPSPTDPEVLPNQNEQVKSKPQENSAVAIEEKVVKHKPIPKSQIKPPKDDEPMPQKVEKQKSFSDTKPPSVEKESGYTSLYQKKLAPETFDEWNKLKTSCAMMLSTGTKGTSKATLLTSRKQLASMNNTSLIDNVSNLTYGSAAFLKSVTVFGDSFKSMPISVALTSYAPAVIPPKGAILIGLTAAKFGWSMEDFLAKCHKSGAQHALDCVSRLSKEFGRAGSNASFRSLMLSTPCTIGKATEKSQKSHKAVGIKNTMGMSVENVGCDIGGPDDSCSEIAARISLLPTPHRKFQLSACNDEDIVTLNGERVQASNGAFPLNNYDIVSVGARVFVFVQTYATDIPRS